MKSQNTITLSLDLLKQKQTFIGWGTSLCWWANVLGNWRDQELAKEICVLLFSPTKGLGINQIRYNLGAGKEPPNLRYMRKGANIPCYAPQEGIWDMQADLGQRTIVSYALENGVTILEAFLNSPPHWMTKNGCTSGSPSGLCNLKTEYFQPLAQYLVSCCQKLKAEYGILFQSLSPFNEPLSFWWKENNNQEGCHFDVLQQSYLIEEINKLIEQQSLDLIISGPECWSTYETIYACNHYTHRALQVLGQINTHTYHNDEQSRLELCRLSQRLKKPLWMSELSCGGTMPQSHEDMDSALELSEAITLHLNQMEAVGWVYWQAVENALLNHNHGLIQAEFGENVRYSLTKQYYVFAQYSRLLRPGYRILVNDDERHIITARSDDQKRIVIVAFNRSSDRRMLHLQPPAGFFLQSAFQTGPSANFQSVYFANYNEITIAPQSVLSLSLQRS